MIFHLDTDNYKDISFSFSENEMNADEFAILFWNSIMPCPVSTLIPV